MKVAILAGRTSATVAVTTVDNTVIEDRETFTATITAVSLPAGVSLDEERATATGTIFDNDRATVSLNGGEATEGDDVVFTVSLSRALDTAVTVSFSTADGTAHAPSDYRARDRVEVTVPARETSAAVAVPTIDDELVESDESFTATIAALDLPAGVGLNKGQATAAGTIINNDEATVSISGGEATEGDDVVFTVSLSQPLDTSTALSFSAVDGSAHAPADYRAQDRVEVTVPARKTSATVAVPTIDDEQVEGDESFTATIAALDLPASVSLDQERTMAAATIMDNDEAAVSLSGGEAAEGDDVIFTVSLSQPLYAAVTVSFSTADGTAHAPEDYSVQDAVHVVIEAGESSATIAVPTLDDGRIEEDETFTATIAAVSVPAGVTLGDHAGTATIIDDDAERRPVLERTLALTGRGILSHAADLGIWSQPCVARAPETPAQGAAAYAETETWQQRADASDYAATNGLTEWGGAPEVDDGPEYSSRRINLDELLYNRDFTISLNPAWAGDGACRTLWGKTGLQRFDAGSQGAGSRQDGHLKSGWLGLDMSLSNRWSAGVAVSHNASEADYSYAVEEGDERGRFKTELTAVHPYLRRPAGADAFGMWAMLGLGTGEARHRSAGGEVRETSDLSMVMGAAGMRWRLAAREADGAAVGEGSEAADRRELSLIGDVGVTRLKTDGGDFAVDDLEAIAARLRFGVEYSQTGAFKDDATLTRLAQLSGFWDGGDGETGFGVTGAAGLRYAGPRLGLEAQARGSASEDYHEYGVNLSAQYANRRGRGVSLSFSPNWRVTNIGAAALPGGYGGIGQGLDAATGSPAAGSLGGNQGSGGNGNRNLRLGVQFHFPSLHDANRRLDIELSGERSDSDFGADPGYRIGIDFKGVF